jgi:hypothetical protein
MPNRNWSSGELARRQGGEEGVQPAHELVAGLGVGAGPGGPRSITVSLLVLRTGMLARWVGSRG